MRGNVCIDNTFPVPQDSGRLVEYCQILGIRGAESRDVVPRLTAVFLGAGWEPSLCSTPWQLLISRWDRISATAAGIFTRRLNKSAGFQGRLFSRCHRFLKPP